MLQTNTYPMQYQFSWSWFVTNNVPILCVKCKVLTYKMQHMYNANNPLISFYIRAINFHFFLLLLPAFLVSFSNLSFIFAIQKSHWHLKITKGKSEEFFKLTTAKSSWYFFFYIIKEKMHIFVINMFLIHDGFHTQQGYWKMMENSVI